MDKKENDWLKDFVSQNHTEFDRHRPDKNLWSRINDTAKNNQTTENTPGSPGMWRKLAAAIIILFALYGGTSLVYDLIPEKNQQQTAIAPIQNGQLKELYEVKTYYSSQINNKVNQLEEYCGQYPDICKEMSEEIKSMNAELSGLKKDLRDNADNKEVLEAMIRNYRIKLQIMENLLENVKRIESYENNESPKTKNL